MGRDPKAGLRHFHKKVNMVRNLLGLTHTNQHPKIAFCGTVIIAIVLIAAFANVANAGGCTYNKFAEATPEKVDEKNGQAFRMEA